MDNKKVKKIASIFIKILFTVLIPLLVLYVISDRLNSDGCHLPWGTEPKSIAQLEDFLISSSDKSYQEFRNLFGPFTDVADEWFIYDFYIEHNLRLYDEAEEISTPLGLSVTLSGGTVVNIPNGQKTAIATSTNPSKISDLIQATSFHFYGLEEGVPFVLKHDDQICLSLELSEAYKPHIYFALLIALGGLLALLRTMLNFIVKPLGEYFFDLKE